jgi:flagellin-like protein
MQPAVKKIRKKSKAKMRKIQRKGKKAISPVVATILLVSMVVMIALVIFLWFRGISKEAVTKFNGINVEVVCADVAFKATYSSGTLYVENTGNVPLYSMKMRVYGTGTYSTTDLHDSSTEWPEKGLNPGSAYSSTEFTTAISSATRVFFVPVLIGNSETGQKLYTCQEMYGQDMVSV